MVCSDNLIHYCERMKVPTIPSAIQSYFSPGFLWYLPWLVSSISNKSLLLSFFCVPSCTKSLNFIATKDLSSDFPFSPLLSSLCLSSPLLSSFLLSSPLLPSLLLSLNYFPTDLPSFTTSHAFYTLMTLKIMSSNNTSPWTTYLQNTPDTSHLHFDICKASQTSKDTIELTSKSHITLYCLPPILTPLS